MDKRIVFGGIFAAALVLVLAAGVLFSSQGTQPQPYSRQIPLVNVDNYSYSVSVDKPAIFLTSQKAKLVDQKAGTELTIYNQDLALVKDVREMDLKSGVNLVEFKDIAKLIDATSVLFRDLKYDDTTVLEQNYEFDIVSREKILEKYLGKEITVQVNEGQDVAAITGKLLSATDGLVLQTSNGIVSVSDISKISFPSLPEGLITKPTLVWKVWTQNDGARDTETSYLTHGMAWRADYVAKVNSDDSAMDFSGWATISNNSGTYYPDTKLKLVAGDLHLVTSIQPYPERFYDYAVSGGGAAPKQFSQENLFEYHLYSLDRTTDLKDNETKQISLLSAFNVPVQKEFVFDGAANGTDVQVKLKFKNSQQQGLGVPIPKGIVRVYKEDSSKQLQFVGEDSVDHTKTDDEVRLFLGNAFDVSGERIQTESVNAAKGLYRNSYEIVLQNQKDTGMEVIVAENIGQFGSVTKFSDPFDKKSATKIEFKVKVPAKGEKKVSYTVETRTYYQ
ncbi:MAG: DUF4139 domain-containing protein [archaeon]